MPPGRRRRRRRSQRRAWLAIFIVLLGLEAAAPLAGVPTARFLEASVTGDLQAADVDLRQGFILLEAGYRNQDAAKVQAAQARFARSRDQLQALSRRLPPLDP